MLVALILIAAVAAGGFAVTYFFENDEPFLWRFGAGTVIGSAVFGMVSFVLAMAVGLNVGTAVAALVITLLPLAAILRGPRRKRFQVDWDRAKGKMQGASRIKALRFFYYAAFLLLFVLFFAQTMYETDQGIFTGGSNNLGDLPFHLGAILSFTDGANFPPQNPSFAGAKFSYPFISDLVTACFMKLGAGLREAMVVQNIAWAFALLVVLERFVLKLTGDRLASKLAPFLLFFSGGLGFIWFLGDFAAQGKGLVEFVSQLPKDYTIGEEFRWGNSMITLFMTQRSLLLGMPLTVIVLGGLWRIFTSEPGAVAAGFRNTAGGKNPVATAPGSDRKSAAIIPSFVVGLIAGMLPLVHLHSLAVLFVVAGVLFFFRLDRWREWTAFGIGVCIVAVPQLMWALSGSASETAKFFEWHFGWDSRDANIFWFWLKNTGIFIPMAVAGMYLVLMRYGRQTAKDESNRDDAVSVPHAFQLLLFYIPFVLLFVIANVAKLAPWEWDNIKVLIYWWIGSIPFVALAVAWMWRKGTALKAVAGACFAVLIFSGSLDVWRTVSGAVKTRVFDADAVKLAERIKRSAPAAALFLNAPTYNSAVVLTGRQSLMRYPGHLASHGIDYASRENDVKKMYAGGPEAEALLRSYGIDYVLISPEERSALRANEAFFKKFSVTAEVGQYKVYRIR
ncbi:MAG: hypothetical protein AB7F88_07970 [Pyrinomonadaceae bacterium]